jgi:hypothetical protein
VNPYARSARTMRRFAMSGNGQVCKSTLVRQPSSYDRRRSAIERYEYADADPRPEQQEEDRDVFATGRLPLHPAFMVHDPCFKPQSASSRKGRTTPQRGRR